MASTLATTFKTTLIDFISDLSHSFPDMMSKFMVIQYIIEYNLDSDQLVRGFYDNHLDMRTELVSHNDAIFTSGQLTQLVINSIVASMSSQVAMDSVAETLNDMWISIQRDDENKQIIWDWIDGFVQLSTAYYDSKT